MEVPLGAVPLETGGEHGTEAVDGADEEEEEVEFLRVEVQGRQFQIEIDQGKGQRYRQIEDYPAESVANGLPGFAGLGGRGREAALPVLKVAGVERPAKAAGVEIKEKRHNGRSFLMVDTGPSVGDRGKKTVFYFMMTHSIQEKYE